MSNQSSTSSNARPSQDELLHMVQCAAEGTLSRRGFVVLAGAIGAGQLVASQLGPLRRAFGAVGGPSNATVPGGSMGAGNLVTVFLNGGNDGLNTLIPVLDPEYHRVRPSIKIMPDEALSLGAGVQLSLHPSLVNTQAKYLQGRVALIAGVGYNMANLSHFSSRDHWEAGRGSLGSAILPTRAGWLGRWLDTAGAGPLGAITFRPEDTVPVGTAVPPIRLRINDTDLTGAPTSDPSEILAQNALRAMAASTGLGTYANELGGALASAVTAGASIAPNMANIPSGLSSISRQMLVAARLLNAGVGTRVITTSTGGYDTHQDQAIRGQDGQPFGWHGRLLSDLDNALALFFASMTPAVRANTTVLVYSEFGRRVEENGSHGTDHGTSSVAMVMGDGVNGGIFGAQPSLTALDSRKNMVMNVDFRSVYATLLSRFLGGDDVAIIGSAHTRLLLSAADAAAATSSTTSTTSSTTSTTTSTLTSSTVGSTIAGTTTIGSTVVGLTVPPTTVESASTTGPTTGPTTAPTTAPPTTTGSSSSTTASTVPPTNASTMVPPTTSASTTTATTQPGTTVSASSTTVRTTTASTTVPTTTTTVPTFPPPVVVPSTPGPGKPSDPDPLPVSVGPVINPDPVVVAPPTIGFDIPAEPDPTLPPVSTLPPVPSSSSSGGSTTIRVPSTTPRPPTTKPSQLALRRKRRATTTKRRVVRRTTTTVKPTSK